VVELSYLVIHGIVTLLALVGVAVRLEHRITKIETDVKWLIAQMNPGPKGVKKNDSNRKMD